MTTLPNVSRSAHRVLALTVAAAGLAVALFATSTARGLGSCEPCVRQLIERLHQPSDAKVAQLMRVAEPLAPLLERLPLERLRRVRLTHTELDLAFDFGPAQEQRVRIEAPARSAQRWHALLMGRRVRFALADERVVGARPGDLRYECGAQRSNLDLETAAGQLLLVVDGHSFELKPKQPAA